MIKVGDKLPSVKLKTRIQGDMKDLTTEDIFAGKKVALFGLPGAFTPTCSAKHLPGYVEHADAIRAKGVDTIACLSVNDAFKKGIKRFTDENPSIARQIELVPIAQLQREPLFARSIVDAFVGAEAKKTGTVIWLDWKGEAMTAIGQKRDVDTPAYVLLDRHGEVRWGRFGKLDDSHEQALLAMIQSLTA